jgi:hypothetical protein
MKKSVEERRSVEDLSPKHDARFGRWPGPGFSPNSLAELGVRNGCGSIAMDAIHWCFGLAPKGSCTNLLPPVPGESHPPPFSCFGTSREIQIGKANPRKYWGFRDPDWPKESPHAALKVGDSNGYFVSMAKTGCSRPKRTNRGESLRQRCGQGSRQRIARQDRPESVFSFRHFLSGARDPGCNLCLEQLRIVAHRLQVRSLRHRRQYGN